MGCRWYLAMTGAEFFRYSSENAAAWMSCRFSSMGSGLGNLPPSPPALLILDDQTPFTDHDPRRIAAQLAQAAQGTEGILLDFQRDWDAVPVIREILQAAPCPVAVTEKYAQGLDCGVFLCPALNLPLAQGITSWADRDIWLDIPTGMQVFTVDKDGCGVGEICEPEGDFSYFDPDSHCRYRIEKSEKEIRFSLYRPPEALGDILQEAETLGIKKAVGLYQDFYELQNEGVAKGDDNKE